jgi:hypothetical protein
VVGSVVAGRGVQAARPGGGRYRPRRAGHDHLLPDGPPLT